MDIEKIVSDKIIEKQKDKQFKDTDIVKYSKKYQRNYDLVSSQNLDQIETDSVLAYKLVDKKNVWKEYIVPDEKLKGMNAGIVYYKVKLRESLTSKPFNSTDARELYVKNIEKLQTEIQEIKTVSKLEDYLENFIDFSTNNLYYGNNDTKSRFDRYRKFESIFGKRFINFCKHNTEASHADYRLAVKFEENNYWKWSEKEEKGTTEKTTQPKKPQINTKVALDYIKRVGGLKIPEINTDSLLKYFCFNNVIYGNYVDDNFSREHTRHFLGALSDLSEILNIDICEINKLGKLDIAFGAVGGGSKHKAFYSASNKVINLTKTKGDGSIAHEWFHYFDNVCYEQSLRTGTPVFLSEKSIQFNKLSILFDNLMRYIYKGNETSTTSVRFERVKGKSYRISGNTVEEMVKDLQLFYPKYKYSSRVNEKNVKDVYGYIANKFDLEYIEVELILNTTEYYKRSSETGGSYWIENVELFARAFEAYIQLKLENQNRYNNYLVSYKEGWTLSQYFPYPEGKELDVISEHFDKIFAEFKTQFSIGEFKPFTTEREDTYIDFQGSTDKKIIETGIILDSDTKEVEKIIFSDYEIPFTENIDESYLQDIELSESLPIKINSNDVGIDKLKELCIFADKNNKTIIATVSNDKIVEFERLGFTINE